MRLSCRVGWIGIWLLAVIMAVGPAAWGQQQATVKVRDGRTVTGTLMEEDAERVILNISGIRTPIARDQIESIQIFRSVQEEYAERRGKLAENDLDGRYDLALWLYEQEAYELARNELQDLSARFPEEARVTVLRNAVEGRLKLLEESQPPSGPPPAQPPVPPVQDPPPSEPAQAVPPGLPDQKLSQEEINLIKLYEADLSTRPTVIVPREVVDEIFEKYGQSELVPRGRAAQTAFRGAKGYEQLELLFKLRARELYPKVTVRNDPPAILQFRRELHSQYVLSYCASNGCHGDASGGNLFLFRTSPNSDPTVYTNFFILHRYETATAYMLDRDMPEKSLLLHYGMDRSLTGTPHPAVPGYAPRIRQASDPQIRMITDFVSKLFKPAPNYGISYTPPTPGAKAKQATPPPPTDTPAEP